MISVCVPIYNTIDYLEKCLESLINQSYKDLEIILVDDGSTDGSEVLCDEYARRDSRIKVIHKQNGGEASARNAGLRASTGDYIAFSDSDDEYCLDAFEIMIKEIQKYDADMVVGGYLEVGKEIHFAIPNTKTYSSKNVASAFMNDKSSYGDTYIFSTVNGKLFDANIIRRNGISFDEKFVVGNDTIFMCDYLTGVKIVVNTFTPVYTYYKYELGERVQGMSWYYPDSFLLDLMVINKLNYLLGVDGKHNSIVHYMNLIKQLVDLVSYENTLEFSIETYIDYCKKIFPFLKEGARLEIEENIIRDKFRNNIPYKLISYVVANGQYDKLGELLRLVNKANNCTASVQNNYVRMMVHI